jgi:dTDP-4-dehydrorhamnose reductase
LYGPGSGNFVETILRLGAERDQIRVVADQRGSPTYTDDLAEAIFRLLEAGQNGTQSQRSAAGYGIYHFSNEGDCSWHEFATTILAEAREFGMKLGACEVIPITTEEYPLPATRPKYSILSKRKYIRATSAEVPDWHDGLARYMASRHNAGAASRGAQR